MRRGGFAEWAPQVLARRAWSKYALSLGHPAWATKLARNVTKKLLINGSGKKVKTKKNGLVKTKKVKTKKNGLIVCSRH